jgi:cytochrome c oxidase subunit I+III
MGIAVFVVDVLRPKKNEPNAARNPWNAGTLEWLAEMPDKPWGVRSIPEIDGRYPLWDQKNLMLDVDEGRFYLPDAEEEKRETLVTSPIDAQPTQCLRVGGPTFVTLWAAIFVGGVFILSTFHLWWPALVSGLLGLAAILRWAWATGPIPEKREKNVGLGLTLPIYVSGPKGVGWWAMLITMLGDMVAFVALVFGYLFYWTVNEDFPPRGMPGPDARTMLVALALLLGAWLATERARRENGRDRAGPLYAWIGAAALLAVVGGAAMIAALADLDPKAHVYPAIVWILAIWTVLHVAVGVVMHLYCMARRAAKRMTGEYDADIVNVTLYWQFVAVTSAVTVVVVVGFPLAV